jgi:hypothetical protein
LSVTQLEDRSFDPVLSRQRFLSLRRTHMTLTRRFPLFIAALAATALTILAAPSAVTAADAVPTRCQTEFTAAEQALAQPTADSSATARAQRLVSLGVRLCEAGNYRGGRQKLSEAVKTLADASVSAEAAR